MDRGLFHYAISPPIMVYLNPYILFYFNFLDEEEAHDHGHMV